MGKLTTTFGTLGHYLSRARKTALAERLGTIEHLSDPLLEIICEQYCRYPRALKHKGQLDKKCEKCPVTELRQMIDGQ